MADEHITVTETYEITGDFSDKTSANGGAIYVKAGGDLTSDGLTHTFSGNAATNQYGGAIWADNATFTISNITFESNQSAAQNSKGGGAIGISGGGTYAISDCKFDGNSATKGGAIFLGTGTLTVENSEFATATDSIWIGGSNASLNFVGTIDLAASIQEASANTTASKATLNGATINFTNTSDINVVKLVNGTSAEVVSDSAANTLAFNGDALVNFTSRVNGKIAQNLNGFALVYTGDKDAIINTPKKIATGVNVLDDNSLEYFNDNKIVGFFTIDTAKDLYYNYADTLKVVYAAQPSTDPQTFDSLDALYTFAPDFVGSIDSTVEEGVTIGSASKAKSLRGAYKKVESATVTINGTVTGSAMAFYADDDTVIMSDDPLTGNILSTTVTVGETGEVDKYVIGGAYTKNGMVTVLDAYTVLQGTVNGHTFGGSFVYGADGAGLVETSLVEIDGATIADGKYVFAGGMASSEGVSYVTAAELDVFSDTDAQVFGGGWGQLGSTAEVETAEIYLYEGTADTVFAGGTNDSTGKSDVTDSSTIYLAGGNANIIYLNGKNSASTMTGTATLVVQLDAEVEWIEGLTASGFGGTTDTVLEVGANLTVNKIAHVDNWVIESGCTVDYTGTLSFKQNYVNGNDPDHVEQFGNKIALDITGAYTDDWTVVSTADKISNFNGEFLEVTLFGKNAAYDEAQGAFISSDNGYALFLSEDKKSIQLAQAV